MDWIGVTDQIEDRYKSQYVGDVYTDIQFAANKFMTSWYFRNSQYIGPEEEEYVFNGNTEENDYVFLTILPILSDDKPMIGGCGTDIQLHSSKGAIGLRIDGTQNINVDGVYVHDIKNWADLGSSTWCGPYPGPDVGNEDIDIQYGYTGTRSHGIVVDFASGTFSNIIVEDIESYNGEANGMTVYKECDLVLENVKVDNIHAGTQLDDEQVDALESPNLIPRACGVDIRPNTLVSFNDDVDGIINGDDIVGFETCFDDEEDGDDVIFAKKNKMKMRNRPSFKLNMSEKILLIILSMAIILYAIKVAMGRCGYNDINDDIKCVVNNISRTEYTPLLN